VNMMMQMTDCPTFKQAENHYDFLIREKKLPELKRGGRVVGAQKTTTKRSCVRVEQQLRWHVVIDDVWEAHADVNLPRLDFMKLRAHFMLNLDETGVQLNDGIINIVGSANRKKHEKNMDDCRDSITIIRMGSAAGQTGPWIFLLKGKKLDRNVLMDLQRNFGAPPPRIVCRHVPERLPE
jgi:hypothetical protein